MNVELGELEELYQEVRTGVNLMTDLIDSLLEFARTRNGSRVFAASLPGPVGPSEV